jgi:hypothetical protein
VLADLPLKFNGTPAGVKEGGKLVTKMKSLKVKTLPKYLKENIEVDISNLNLNENVRVEDVKADNMEIMNSPRIPIASVVLTRQLKQEEAATTTAAPAAAAAPAAKAPAKEEKKNKDLFQLRKVPQQSGTFCFNKADLFSRFMQKFLIVGLGNTGNEYRHTRHNIGFDVVSAFVLKHNGFFQTVRLAERAEVRWKGKIFTCIKPTTYMNLSGKAFKYWLDAEKNPAGEYINHC